MSTRRPILAALLSFTALIASAHADRPTEKAGDPFLSVGLPALHHQRQIQAGMSFPAIITNVSDKPLRIWRDWCSWGYYNITLDFEGPDGKIVTCKKRERGWPKNYPDFAELAHGESVVFNVQLTSDIWENLPALADVAAGQIKMRVRYEIPPDREAREDKVWTGKLESNLQEYGITK